MRPDRFDDIWNDDRFSLRRGRLQEMAGPCPHAVAFQAWLDSTKPRIETRIDLNQRRLLVLIRYSQITARLPLDHRPTTEPHVCLHEVLDAAVAELDDIELRLEPPQFVEVAVAPAARRRRLLGPLDGLLFGDIEDDE